MKLYTIFNVEERCWFQENNKPYVSDKLETINAKVKKIIVNGNYIDNDFEIVECDFFLNKKEDILYSIFVVCEEYYTEGFLGVEFVFLTENLSFAEKEMRELSSNCKAKIIPFYIV